VRSDHHGKEEGRAERSVPEYSMVEREKREGPSRHAVDVDKAGPDRHPSKKEKKVRTSGSHWLFSRGESEAVFSSLLRTQKKEALLSY